MEAFELAWRVFQGSSSTRRRRPPTPHDTAAKLTCSRSTRARSALRTIGDREVHRRRPRRL